MEIKKVTDKAFRKYGAVIEGMDLSELLAGAKTTPAPDDVFMSRRFQRQRHFPSVRI